MNSPEEKSDEENIRSENQTDNVANDLEKNEPAEEPERHQDPGRSQQSGGLRRILSRPRTNDPKDEAFRVDWEANEPGNPRNFSTRYKIWVTIQLGFMALTASIGSSIIAPAETAIAEYVGVGSETIVLMVALYVLGFAFGPMAWAPISEVYGRKWSMLPAVFILALFSIGTAVSKNAASIFITRFFAGLFGSAPVR